MLRRILLGTALFLAPVSALAATTTWDLQNQTQIEGWNVNNLTSVRLLPEGLVISTQAEGQLVKVSNLSHQVDTVSITYTSETGGEGILFWRAPNQTGNEVYQIPISFLSTTSGETMILDLSRLPEWDYRSDRIGFVLPAGTQLTLQDITFSGPDTDDILLYPLKTFFTSDQIRSYVINFQWGPLMTYSEDQYERLYDDLPPNGDSWNRIFYAILLVGLLLTLGLRKKFGHKATGGFFLLFALLWVLYDVRMGIEHLRYSKDDIDVWWTQPEESREFRDWGQIHTFAASASEFTKEEDTYVFLSDNGWPYINVMRYTTYPALPLSYTGNTISITPEEVQDIRVWAVHNATGVSITPDNRLTLNGVPISPPGHIVYQLDNNSFLFSVENVADTTRNTEEESPS